METTSAKTKISGKQTHNFKDVKDFEVADTSGHVVSLRKAEGVNKSSADATFMNDAKMVNLSYDDLVKGSGPHQGYTNMEKDGDHGVSKWQGKIETKMQDGKPVPTFKGTFSFISGTGILKKIVGGGGTYKGYFTSETSYVVDWEGEF
jgi:hypothetical protein